MSDDWNHWVYNDILKEEANLDLSVLIKKINPLPN